MASSAADGVLPELQRELDEFMATHATTLATAASQATTSIDIATTRSLQAPLERIQWIATTLAAARLCETTQGLLAWLLTLAGRDATSVKSATWLVGYLVGEMLETTRETTASEQGATEKMVEHVLDRCVVVFQETFQLEAARAVESGGGFFAFKPLVSHLRPPTADDNLQDSVATAWRRVVALVSLCSLNPIRLRLQKQLLPPLLQPKGSVNGKEYLLLKNLSDIRLGLDSTTFLWTSTFPQKIRDAALLLKMLQPLVLKPHKPPTRLAALTAIASLFDRELDALEAAALQCLYTSVHGITEWTTTLSELHATTLKLCGKREFAVAAWDLRIALLSVSPNEIYSRYWKEDVHALLRVQYQHNKDGGGASPHAPAILMCVGRCFTHALKRHFLTERRIPGELDCMEIINTTQAWCFFAYPKHRSMDKLLALVVPVLVQLSIGIAAYNLLYSIQSHLRRLLLEADHIFDEKKLVGLEAVFAVCERCSDHDIVDPSLPLDRNVLLANRSILGELVGQTLIEANALFGGELLIESSTAHAAGSAAAVRTANLPISAATKLLKDEYRRAIAIRAYSCALRNLKHLYVALELSDDQKILILVRSCIHNEAVVRESAATALHHVIRGVSRQASAIFRGVTDYIFRLSNHLTTPRDFEAFVVLIQLITSLLQSIIEPSDSSEIVVPWQSRKAKQESLLQIESVAVYLLVFEDARLLEAAVTALKVVSQARAATFQRQDMVNALAAATVERPSVIDVLRKADLELQELLFSFESREIVEALVAKDLGCFRQLIADLAGTSRASFRWSSSLAVVYAQLAIWNPEVVAFMWSDVNDKVTKLEPAMPSLLENDVLSGNFELARWRNLAVLATTTACPHLLFQTESPDDNDSVGTPPTENDTKDASVQSVISSSAVQSLFKRLCRFLKSPSIEQKKAAILALGSTHVSSLPILTEVLQKYETDAFVPMEPPPPLNTSRHGSQGDITPPVPNGNGFGPRRLTKEQKARNLKATAQLQLQWALGRCYRLLLHTTQHRPLLLDETTREAVLRLQAAALNVIDKTVVALQHLHPAGRVGALDPRDAPLHIVFMMQQDLCSSIRAVASLHDASQISYRAIRRRRRAMNATKLSTRRSSITSSLSTWKDPDGAASPVFDPTQREAWYALLLSWCQSFSSFATARLSSNLSGSFFAIGSPARDHWMQRCDVVSERVDDTLVPWQWMDEGDATRALGIQEAAMASFQRFFVCQTAFATLAVVAFGPVFLPTPITTDAAVFRWLDECFAVETSGPSEPNAAAMHHFQVLQDASHRVLGAFLQSDFRTFVEICVDKAFFTVSSGDKHNIAKHYFRAICSVSTDLKRLLNDTGDVTEDSTPQRPATSLQNLQVRVCHAILMHLGIESDAAQRQRAVQLINDLYGDETDNIGDDEAAIFRLNATVSSAKRSNATFGAQVTNRMQIAGASFLVQKLPALSYQMSMSMLKFVSCCEATQQKKTLVVVLPWLAQVSLVGSALDADQLISLLFRITTNLGATCSDQLEQAWLTLAFAEQPNSTDDHQSQDSNLSKVLQFLFLQRTTSVRLATAKTVVWWLCRWQSATHEVLREALLLVETRRRESASSLLVSNRDPGSTIQPVDDVFVFVVLMSDSCSHLATIPSYLYKHPAMRDAMMVQTVHFAFLALFALALDPQAFAVRRTVPSASGRSLDDHQHQSLYADASNDCLVMLRNLLSQLYGPVELLAPIVDDLATWSAAWEDVIDTNRAARKPRSTRQLEQAMGSFASCLPPSLRNLWALECVKEIALALVPGSTLLQATSSRCNNTQVLHCVRFGLLGYRVLAPEFHGDVFLTLLDLLHHALDEHARDPSSASAVIAETLQALRSMVACMPPPKLALYPQVLWVCVALLNHGKADTLAFHPPIVELLVEILNMPHFATNQLLQDVVWSKKPPQWSEDQASVLRALVWSLDRSPVVSQHLVLSTVASFLVLPSLVFHANAIEHLIILSMTLLPFILADLTHKQVEKDDTAPDQDDAFDDEHDGHSCGKLDSRQLVTDFRYAWLAAHSELLGDAFAKLQSGFSREAETPEDDDGKENRLYGRALVAQFAAALVPELLTDGADAGALVSLCFEILVKVLAAEDAKKRHWRAKEDAIVAATLWLVEALMVELGRRKFAWRPTSVLVGSLARLVRTPEQTPTWRAAVRIMSCLGPSNRTTTATRIPNSPSNQNDRAAVAPLSLELPARTNSLQMRDDSASSGASTPSKKDGAARKLFSFMGHRASGTGSNHSSPSHYHTNQRTPPNAVTKHASTAHDPSEERRSDL